MTSTVAPMPCSAQKSSISWVPLIPPMFEPARILSPPMSEPRWSDWALSGSPTLTNAPDGLSRRR